LAVLKYVKIREFKEILNFVKFEFSIYGCQYATSQDVVVADFAREYVIVFGFWK